MFNQDTYHAAMLFCKNLAAELEGQDLAAWVRSELRKKHEIPKLTASSNPIKETHYQRFLRWKEYQIKNSA